MPFKYTRKSNRASWDVTAMELAVECVQKNEMGVRMAAKQFNVPVTTLRRKARNPGTVIEPVLGRKCALGITHERELCIKLKVLESYGFPLYPEDLRKLAYEFAERNGYKHTFNKEKKAAGYYWMQGFLKRHPDIAMRKAEGLSPARASAMNRTVVGKYFKMLEEALENENLRNSPNRIYNMDESGIQLVNKPGKVLAAKGRKSVVALTNAEHGENVTVVGCCSAAGIYVPPYIIMKGVRRKDEWVDGLPPGSELGMSPTSYINKDIFLTWLKHFRKHVVGKVLLIMDGHGSHVQSLEALEYATNNDIIMICLPPHTTKYLQPLDRTVFKPLKTYFHNAANRWMRNQPGRGITKYQFPMLFSEAWGKTATVGTAVNGFAACGIFPFNPEAIPEVAFAPSETTEREMPAVVDVPGTSASGLESQTSAGFSPVSTGSSLVPSASGAPSATIGSAEALSTSTQSSSAPRPTGSSARSSAVATPGSSAVATSGSSTQADQQAVSPTCHPFDIPISFDDIMSIPKIQRSTNTAPRKTRKAVVLTSPVYIQELKDQARTSGRKSAAKMGLKAKSKGKGANKGKKKAKKAQPTDADNSTNYCGVCDGYYFDAEGDDDDWIECQVCTVWFHEACVNAQGKTHFICEECKMETDSD